MKQPTKRIAKGSTEPLKTFRKMDYRGIRVEEDLQVKLIVPR